MTQKEYADRKGWSKQYVNQLVKKGQITLQAGKIDPIQADAALARGPRSNAGSALQDGHHGPGDTP